MKFIPLHTRNTAIVYKNSLCSSASIIVLVFIILSVMVPVLLVSLLSPYSGITESRVLYEQPRLLFQHRNIFVGETASKERGAERAGLVACSSFPEFNERMESYGKHCASSQYWTEDLDHDGISDRVHFQLELADLEQPLKSFNVALFFEAKLQHKCTLFPPALLTHHLVVPPTEQLTSGTIHLKAELQLKQYIEFTCPFPGRHTKTYFRQVDIKTNSSTVVDIQQFQLESLLEQLKANPAYFQLLLQETYYRRAPHEEGLKILIDLDVLQVPARYHLGVWERLGQFWLYFASFFGISFYVMNKLKDYLFSRHIIRSWEIIPWKKLY